MKKKEYFMLYCSRVTEIMYLSDVYSNKQINKVYTDGFNLLRENYKDNIYQVYFFICEFSHKENSCYYL